LNTPPREARDATTTITSTQNMKRQFGRHYLYMYACCTMHSSKYMQNACNSIHLYDVLKVKLYLYWIAMEPAFRVDVSPSTASSNVIVLFSLISGNPFIWHKLPEKEK
jgi:hypothetical protein